MKGQPTQEAVIEFVLLGSAAVDSHLVSAPRASAIEALAAPTERARSGFQPVLSRDSIRSKKGSRPLFAPLKPAVRLNVLEDIPDNRILECAVEAGADVIVTGDRHLLKLKKCQGIPIVRLVDFLRMFPEEVR